MSKARTMLIAAVTACALAGTIAAAGSSTITARAETLSMVSEFVRARSVDVEPDGPSPGDQTLARERLVDENTRERLGSERRTCTEHFGGDLCQFTFAIAGRGQIVAGGFIGDGEPGSLPTVSMPILGGDGDFGGARGVVVIEFREADFRFTFELM